MLKAIIEVDGLFTGTPVPGATDPTYELTEDDVGEMLYWEVTATNGAGTAMKQSDATGEIIEAPAVNLWAGTGNMVAGADWVAFGGSLAGDAVNGPDGTLTAGTFGSTGGGNHALFNNPASLSAGRYTASLYVKPGTANWVFFGIWNGIGGGARTWYNLQTNTLGATSLIAAGYANISVSKVAAANGYVRLIVSADLPAGDAYFYYRHTDDDNTQSQDTVDATTHVWGAQLEVGGTVHPFVPT